MRRKTLSVNASTVLLSTILLAKLTVELVNKKKKVEEIYLELACTIGVLLLCLVATVLLIREKKEHNKVERSGSSISLNNFDEEVKKEETNEEKQQPLSSSVSCPDGLTNEIVPVEGVRDEVEKIKSTMVKDGESETNNYHNLAGQQPSVENFGKNENIIAITLPESYSIKKYKKIDANREEIIQSTKDGIIDDGDKYKPIDFSVNKVEKINDKGKKEDSYQFIFKFQSVQKNDVFIEISCSTLNVYSGWEKNEEKPVAQYFKNLKANDDFLIFLDVKEILSESLKKVLGFLQKFCPANDQGLSSVEGKMVYEHFGVGLLQEEQCINIKKCYILGIRFSVNKKFPIKDILISDQLIHKEQEVKQEYQNSVDQDIQVDGPTNQNVTTDKETSNASQPQNEHSEVLVSPSPSTSSGIASEETFTDDIVTTESKEKSAQKQSVSRSSSKNSLRSQGSIDSIGKPKKKFKEKITSFGKKVVDAFSEKEKSEGLIDGDEKQKKTFSFKKIKSKFTKNDSSKESRETSPSPSVSTLSIESGAGKDNQSFMPD
ncbi:hypothetical protein [Candidatus Mesenet endosymbiont of Phosphuga atrata]|uniref:hypothetical protein n=1 Tax=Candidatus Mesenet endosymbiont of Phosphuga atrata TaxID=3066221 RepID=UPI0030D51603